MKGRRLIRVRGLAVAFFLLTLAAHSEAYEETPVTGGGALSGRVRFTGTVPEPKVYRLQDFYNHRYCGAVSDGKGNRVVAEVRVDESGGLGDVVVYIRNIEKGKPFTFNGTDVKALKCQFLVQGGPSSLTGVVVRNRDLRLLNEDADPDDSSFILGVKHNPQGNEMKGAEGRMIFKELLSIKGQMITKKVRLSEHDSFVKLECDIHDYMKVYFLPVENPYFTVTGTDGRFAVSDIPAGNYAVVAWHPVLGTIEREISISSSETDSVELEFIK